MLLRVHDVALAAAVLVVVDCAIRIVPFTLIAKRIRAGLRWTASPAQAFIAAGRVGWALAAAKRRIPWTVPCLALAVAANRLLARRGVPSELWLGVRPAGTATIDAHAWLIAEGIVVTGSVGKPQYTPLHSLVTAAPPLAF
jgi:hypothetical protein